jgi:ABC-type transport system involved in multi-copper enzyme maturation permease subunit
MTLFRHILLFELRYWAKGFMVWIFLFILGTLVFGATATDQVTIGGSIGNVNRNAPYVIQIFYSIMAIFAMLMTTAFVNSAASRDFQYNSYQLIFTTPISKSAYLGGRFLGSTLIATLPFFGISLGIILAGFMPWVDPNRFGPISWSAHVASFLTFALPNTVFIAAIVFVIAVLTRSTLASFLGVLLLLTAYAVSDVLTEDIDNETAAMLLDPFGVRTYAIMTKYWTPAERNVRVLFWEGFLLYNRLIWLSVAAAAFFFGYRRFSFAERASSLKAALPVPAESSTLPVCPLRGPLRL